MKLYLSNKSNLNSNSNIDNIYKNKNSNRKKKIQRKKRLTLKISIQHMWIFVYIVINEFYLLCRIFYLLSYVLEISFLSYSFVMIEFLYSAVIAMGSSFKVVFAEKSTCKSREQCTGSTKKRTDANVVSKLTLNETLILANWIQILL